MAGPGHGRAVVIGAGLSGLYALYKLRELGLEVTALEAGDALGGTWLWNRYPGARCDIESIEYSYSFSGPLEQEWVWTETMPAQAEIEAYVNFVADRLDLRRHVQLDTMVRSLTYDESSDHWEVTTAGEDRLRAQFVVAATGMLSVPLDPAIAGMDLFAGTSLFTSRFPKEGFDFTGKRVGIIGTGSTGVQATPVVARQADQLVVFQRSAAYTFPTTSRPFRPGELDELKARYPEIRAAQRAAFAGTARLGAFSFQSSALTRPPLKTASRAEQLAALEERGVAGALMWSDVTTDPEAGELARQLYGEAIARIVHDPETAKALVPTYPFGCKRPIIDDGYFETFNRDNVTLVDLRQDPITAVEPSGIRTARHLYELDVILYATGFDAMTGALTRMDVRGRDGVLLRDLWARDGPATFMGMAVHRFPNLFLVSGPGSPGALANVPTSLELQIDWMTDFLHHLRKGGQDTFEVRAEAQQEWTDHLSALVEGTVVLHPSCNSWWNGANVPGKKRVFLSYAGGIPAFRSRCHDEAAAGYPSCELT